MNFTNYKFDELIEVTDQLLATNRTTFENNHFMDRYNVFAMEHFAKISVKSAAFIPPVDYSSSSRNSLRRASTSCNFEKSR